MSEIELKPLRTWSHLAGNRRKPSEYEIVSTNLHYHMNDTENPWELDPDIPMAQWYRRYRNESPLHHDDWDQFRDPDALVYRTYNILQDGQETYVKSLFEQFFERGHDQMLHQDWLEILTRLYTPSRYAFHTLQLGSAYLHQMAPASTITNCATYQTADSIRWLTHTAYRTKELSNAHPSLGFAQDERRHWEEDEAWQGIRELAENALVAWDWGEALVAINLVLKPVVEECLLTQMGALAREENDTLLGLLTQAQYRDAERHRRWTRALIELALTQESNREVLAEWLVKWQPLGDQAVEAFCSRLPLENAAKSARESVLAYHLSLSI